MDDFEFPKSIDLDTIMPSTVIENGIPVIYRLKQNTVR